MSLSTRAVEIGTVASGILSVSLAQLPSGTNVIVEAVKSGPSVLLAIFVWVLWKRYTTREDEHLKLVKETVSLLQEVKDTMRVCPCSTVKVISNDK